MTAGEAGTAQWYLFGPVRLVAGAAEVPVGPAKQRCVLAALLLTPGRSVPTELLVDRVWGDHPPRAANPAAPYVARLRRVLTGLAAETGTLRHAAGGYLLDCDPESVDLHRARRLAGQARAARQSGDDAAAADLLGAALAGWADPLAGLPGEWASRTRAALAREGLELRAQRAEANLRLGRFGEVVDELLPLVAEHPTAENLAGALMRGLARAGRRAAALDCYAQVRAAIRDQLGTEPSPQLADLQLSILRGAAAPAPPPGAAQPVAPVRPGPAGPPPRPEPERTLPAELPGDGAAFTGRVTELAWLDRVLSGGLAPGAAVVSGTAGVGKTALALHWAQRARRRFPDGQLYVNLRGYDPLQPLAAADALARMLASLGVPERQLPVDGDARAARYRSELADRRVLIVLDNAASVEQVRPLLPSTRTCRVLVTSRDTLTGLVVRDGAQRLDLDLLPLPDAVALLGRLVGPRVGADPDAARALALRCARLPLALRVAAELAASNPDTALDRLVGDPAGAGALDLLDVDGDPQTAVPMVFSWSVRQLPAGTARTFALLGLHPGADFDGYAAAALAGGDLAAARQALDRLARAHLIRPAGGVGVLARYGMHDLLQAYAARLAGAERPAALDRLAGYYLATAAAAMNRLHPAEAHRRPEVAAAATPTPELADPAAARGWLDRQRPTLVALATGAAAHGRPELAVQLSVTLFRYLAGGHSTDALSIHAHARAAAAASGDRAGEGHALIGLGSLHVQLGRHEPALRYLGWARDLFRQAGDLGGEARALSNLGIAEERLGRYHDAARHHQQAIAGYRRSGDRTGLARGLTNAGDVLDRLDRHREAVDSHEQALDLLRLLGDRSGEADALNRLGNARGRLGRRDAVDHLCAAIAIYRELGDRFGEAQALDSLGTVELRLGRPGPARTHFAAALELFEQAGERDGEAWALNGMGEAALATGRPAQALRHHTAALTRAAEAGVPDQQARAHQGLAASHQRLGDRRLARWHHQRAQDIRLRLDARDAAPTRPLTHQTR